MIGRSDVLALKATNLRGSHGGAQIGIFASAFDHTTPAWIARNIQHGCKRPFDADGASFLGSDGLRFYGGSRIPRSGHGDGQRERWYESRE